jgi:protein-disulfide isomerase
MKVSRKVAFLFRNRISLGLSLLLLAAFAALGCRAQNARNTAAKPQDAPLDAKTSRNIEVTLRSKLNIPPDYVISVGARSASTTPGFDNLLVSFELPGHAEHSQKLTFLISHDNKTLERIAQWDISGDTADLVPAGDRPVRGNPNAKVVLVNFDDLECPYCAKLHSELFPETLNHYKGLIKVVYRDLPITSLHPWAMHAAIDANCVAAQNTDAYWGYVDYLHTHGEDITGPDRDAKKSGAMLDKVALQQGEKNKLDTTRLSACVAKQDESGIHEETQLSDKLNIDQTPTLYVNGEVIEGALPEDVLWQAIDRALVAEGVKPPPNPYGQAVTPASAGAAGQGAPKEGVAGPAGKP